MYSIILAITALCSLAQAQSSSQTQSSSVPTTTASLTTSTSAATSYLTLLNIPGLSISGFAASIISADVCRTTYVAECTAKNGCGSGLSYVQSGFKATATEAPFSASYASTTTTDGATIVATASCKVSAKSSATCTFLFGATSAGKSSSSSVSTSFSASYTSIPYTAGTIPSGSCTSTAGGAWPTAAADLYKVVVVPAAAFAVAALV